MIDMKTKERFIALRAKGWSFERISEEICVSKPTLIKWSKELGKEIKNLKFLNFQSLLEQNAISKQMRAELLITELKRVYGAIEKKNYEDLSLMQLHTLRQNITENIKELLSEEKFYTGDKKLFFDSSEDPLTGEETIPLEV